MSILTKISCLNFGSLIKIHILKLRRKPDPTKLPILAPTSGTLIYFYFFYLVGTLKNNKHKNFFKNPAVLLVAIPRWKYKNKCHQQLLHMGSYATLHYTTLHTSRVHKKKVKLSIAYIPAVTQQHNCLHYTTVYLPGMVRAEWLP